MCKQILQNSHLSISSLHEAIKAGSFDAILDNSHTTEIQKIKALEDLLHDLPSPYLLEVFHDQLSKAKLDFFASQTLAIFLSQLQHEAEHIVIVRLTTACKFQEKDVLEMANLLKGRINQRVAFSMTVDPSLIGGAIIQHGNYISDYSIKTRLTQFRQVWHRAAIEKTT
jgi:F0F1-type ATP synthase delta subunit